MLKKMVCCAYIVLSVSWFVANRIFNAHAQTGDGVALVASIFPTGVQKDQGDDKSAEKKGAIAELRKRIAGREDEPAEKVFKNIEILKGKKASVLPGMMAALTGLLGVNCSYCHVQDQWEREDKPTKQTARKMFRMVKTINKDNFDGKNAVSCWTCHRGNPHPPIQ
jgi:Photosynthetic reaction centre cytochrome C subunit